MDQDLEPELNFVRGGPFYRILQRVGLVRGEGPDIPRRIVAFFCVTWLPLLFLSALDGQALGPSPRESFLLDFATYSRFFICMPLLVLAEAIIGPELTKAALHFARSGLLGPKDMPAFHEAAANVARRRESVKAEVIMLCLAFVGSWLAYRGMYAEHSMTWLLDQNSTGARLSPAGLWYNIVAVPFLQFLFYRWLWRLAVWTGFLWEMSRLGLKLMPTNADRAGGLGFLEITQYLFGVIGAAAGVILSGDTAFKLVYEGASLASYQGVFIAYLVAAEGIFLGPLLVFIPVMTRTRRTGVLTYGRLLNRYNQSFHEKWADGCAPEGETFLGSSDIQSLADLGNSYERVQGMRTIPFGRQAVLKLAAIVSLPAIPAILLAMPLKEIVKSVLKALL